MEFKSEITEVEPESNRCEPARLSHDSEDDDDHWHCPARGRLRVGVDSEVDGI